MSRLCCVLMIIVSVSLAGCASFRQPARDTKLILVTASPVESEIAVALAGKTIPIGSTPIKIWITRPNLKYVEITAKPLRGKYPEKHIAIRKGDPVPAALHFDFSKD